MFWISRDHGPGVVAYLHYSQEPKLNCINGLWLPREDNHQIEVGLVERIFHVELKPGDLLTINFDQSSTGYSPLIQQGA